MFIRERQAEYVAADGDADRPGAGVEPLGDADRRIVDLDRVPRRPHIHVDQALVEHQRRGPAVGRVAGTNEAVGDIALRGGLRRDARHDFPGIAGGGTDLQPFRAQRRDGLDYAGDQVGVIGGDLHVFRHENLVERVNVGVRGQAAVRLLPGLGDARKPGQRHDMWSLGHAHRPTRLVDGNLDAELGEGLDEHAHWRERPVVDGRAGPIEDDGFEMAHGKISWTF